MARFYGDSGHTSSPWGELAAIASKLSKLPTVAEYQAEMGIVNADGPAIHLYMNFDQIEVYAEVAQGL